MATQPDRDDEDEILDLENEADGDDPELDQDDADSDDDDDDDSGDDDGETVVTIGDEEPEEGEQDSSVIREMRAKLRDANKRIAEMEKASAAPKIEVGEKPTLAGCEYDEDVYEAELDKWQERKRQAKEASSAAEREAEQAREQWKEEVAAYQSKKAALGFDDIVETEEVVTTALNAVQQAVLIKASDNPAQVMYALGKHLGKLADLAKITDPIKMAATVARMEGSIKMTKKRKAPDPEQIARGSASMSAANVDKKLEALEKEAARTGNRTKVIEYKQSLKSK